MCETLEGVDAAEAFAENIVEDEVDARSAVQFVDGVVAGRALDRVLVVGRELRDYIEKEAACVGREEG